jgi:hypothetical protein
MGLDHKYVTNIMQPAVGLVGSSLRALSLKFSMKDSIHLFIELAVET